VRCPSDCVVALFGAGAALTLDEFALVLHLGDVYWTEEGRSSIEATLMGFTYGARDGPRPPATVSVGLRVGPA
jgi:hypothetical protein